MPLDIALVQFQSEISISLTDANVHHQPRSQTNTYQKLQILYVAYDEPLSQLNAIVRFSAALYSSYGNSAPKNDQMISAQTPSIQSRLALIHSPAPKYNTQVYRKHSVNFPLDNLKVALDS